MPAERAPSLTLWGLKSCDTCRTARKWLEAEGVSYAYRDVRDDGVPESELRAWAQSPAGAALVNRRSTTWRALDAAERARADSDPAGLLAAHPTLIKRPVFVRDGQLDSVGFTPGSRERLAKGR